MDDFNKKNLEDIALILFGFLMGLGVSIIVIFA